MTDKPCDLLSNAKLLHKGSHEKHNSDDRTAILIEKHLFTTKGNLNKAEF